MAQNYLVVPVYQVRDKSYRMIQEDGKAKTFSTEQEAQKFATNLQNAFDLGVESVTKDTKVTT